MRARRGHLELVAVDGHPTELERTAVERALGRLVDRQRAARADPPSGPLRRAQGRRLGTPDFVGRLDGADLWRLSGRMTWAGREYAGKAGRGDAR